MTWRAAWLDGDAAALVAQMEALDAPSLSERGVEGARQYLRASVTTSGARQVMDVHDVHLAVADDEILLRVYRTGGGTPAPIVVFLHGGGWVIGDIETADAFCRRLASSADCIVVSVDYRLAPEHPFPCAVDDAAAAVTWAHRNAESLGADPDRLVVVGDSSGGNLAAVATRHLHGPTCPIARQVLLYPVTDHRLDRESYHRYGSQWPLGTKDMAWFWDLYVPEGQVRDDPQASPLHADLAGLPPTTVIIAGCDPICDEAMAYAEALAAAGVEVDLHLYPGQIHGFATFDPSVLPRSSEALAVIRSAIRADSP